MTILLYDHYELEERPAKHLKVWKAWHLVLYAFAAVFGLVNFILLQSTMQLVDDNCVLFPRKLEFVMMELPVAQQTITGHTTSEIASNLNVTDAQETNETAQVNNDTAIAKNVKREINNDTSELSDTEVDGNASIPIENTTHRLMLDTSRTLFETDFKCQFAEFMPIMSTICAAMWLTMFTMCPGGGHARTGLQQPWRILAPALLFALVMVGLTGHSFVSTNEGLHAFCSDFYIVTNTTTCSAAGAFLPRAWNASWGAGARAGGTRAASAGVVASWACGAALLLARCVAAPDFRVRRTAVHLARDPQRKIIPHLKKAQKTKRTSLNSPSKRDDVSMRSEPTITTELVSATVEHGQDSAPTSLMVTPVKIPRNADIIEMAYNPQERIPEPQ